MTVRKKISREKNADFIAACRKFGIRLTQQRLAVFQEIAASKDHPDAERLFARLRRKMPSLSLDTVYRTLWLLNDLGFITTLGFTREKTRFEPNLLRHHHFVCQSCGLTVDFFSEELDRLKMPSEVAMLGDVDYTQVEVRGFCKACRKSSKSEK